MTGAWPMTPRLPLLAPRTRLYPVEPIGVGTANVESLTGYLMRLAEAHCVTVGTLVAGELLPLLRPQGLGSLPPATWLLQEGPHWNGTGDTARLAGEALATLTARQDLVLLTLWPWRQVLAAHGLIRKRPLPRVWCPACYEDMLAEARPLYEPLLWSLAVVTVCPHHRVRLSARCPCADCARTLPPIAAVARPGHCSWCKRALFRPRGGLLVASTLR